jgi:mannose-6-phosphate isomerase
VWRLAGAQKTYDWGSTTAIPGILGTSPTEEPFAEYWLGTHPGGPATVGPDEIPLDRWLRLNPAVLALNDTRNYDGKLPFLLKILAAEAPLSLQAHPDMEQARAGFAAENEAGVPIDAPERNFKDPYHKPEIIVAFTEFEALSGFRDPEQTLWLFEQLGVRESVMGPFLCPMRERDGKNPIGEMFLDSLLPDGAAARALTDVVGAAVNHVNDEGDVGQFARLAVRLDTYYPNDPSLLAALMLNDVVLAPGEALFTPAGILHAYIQGTGIEVMAASDNVVRGGLTHKHIDAKLLAEVLSFDPSLPWISIATQGPQGVWRYAEPVDEFDVWRIEVSPESITPVPATERGRIMLALEGNIECQVVKEHCEQAEEKATLTSGDALLLAVGEAVSLTGEGAAVLVAIGE